MALNEYDPDATDIRPIADPEGASEEAIRGLQTIIRQRDELLAALKETHGVLMEFVALARKIDDTECLALIASMEEGK